ncbi:uncharacterized protein BJ171DRAFT_234887 [Polychytrium aggregatum]|uniref:uncharacterized protein n=1 Tax=Polychytrium aggregatum TaxID=110093 RepID=UPI0022FE43DA|nr:uncharacterized protein BJ171DRAFT_234887 [Polychytrium aggregatum]KAI9208125.1 hypothetical protein BJ171DRAFT_234887 [Polychytrium aggregatum]
MPSFIEFAEEPQIYLEEFLADIESLAPEVKKSFAELRDIDDEVQDIIARVSTIQHQLKHAGDPLEPSKRPGREQSMLGSIENGYKQAEELIDHKVELVDKNLAMLDQFLKKLDADLQKMGAHAAAQAEAIKEAALVQALQEEADHLSVSDRDKFKTPSRPSSSRSRRAQPSLPRSHSPVQRPSLKRVRTPSQDDEDDDDNADSEQLYCFCKQVSYGDMIGCDSQTCDVEWFHLDCVGLSEPPSGEWYCPRCIEKSTRKRSRSHH